MNLKIIGASLMQEYCLNMRLKVTDKIISGDQTVFVAEPVFILIAEEVITDRNFSKKL